MARGVQNHLQIKRNVDDGDRKLRVIDANQIGNSVGRINYVYVL